MMYTPFFKLAMVAMGMAAHVVGAVANYCVRKHEQRTGRYVIPRVEREL